MTRARVGAGLALLLLIGVGGTLLWRGYFGPSVVTVRNASGALLQGVVLEGEGFSRALSDLAPGTTTTAIVRPRAESTLTVRFLLEGRLVTHADLTYIEAGGGYCTWILVRPGGSVECRTRRGFSWRRAL